jgi:hypothetical protein
VSRGSDATPIAERACVPASPSTSLKIWEAAFATVGCSMKSGVLATKTVSFSVPLI